MLEIQWAQKLSDEGDNRNGGKLNSKSLVFFWGHVWRNGTEKLRKKRSVCGDRFHNENMLPR